MRHRRRLTRCTSRARTPPQAVGSNAASPIMGSSSSMSHLILGHCGRRSLSACQTRRAHAERWSGRTAQEDRRAQGHGCGAAALSESRLRPEPAASPQMQRVRRRPLTRHRSGAHRDHGHQPAQAPGCQRRRRLPQDPAERAAPGASSAQGPQSRPAVGGSAFDPEGGAGHSAGASHRRQGIRPLCRQGAAARCGRSAWSGHPCC